MNECFWPKFMTNELRIQISSCTHNTSIKLCSRFIIMCGHSKRIFQAIFSLTSNFTVENSQDRSLLFHMIILILAQMFQTIAECHFSLYRFASVRQSSAVVAVKNLLCVRRKTVAIGCTAKRNFPSFSNMMKPTFVFGFSLLKMISTTHKRRQRQETRETKRKLQFGFSLHFAFVVVVSFIRSVFFL